MSTTLEVIGLKKYFHVANGGLLHAVDDVSFKIERGDHKMCQRCECTKNQSAETEDRFYRFRKCNGADSWFLHQSCICR